MPVNTTEYISAITGHFEKCFNLAFDSKKSTGDSFAKEVQNLRKKQSLCELNEGDVETHFNDIVAAVNAKQPPYNELQDLANELSKNDDGSIILYVSSKLYQQFANIISKRTKVSANDNQLFKQIQLTRLLTQARDILGEHAFDEIMDKLKIATKVDKKVDTTTDENLDAQIDYVTGEIEAAEKNIELIGNAAWEEIQQIENAAERQTKLELRIAEAEEAKKSLGDAEWKTIRSIDNLSERDAALKKPKLKNIHSLKHITISQLKARITPI